MSNQGPIMFPGTEPSRAVMNAQAESLRAEAVTYQRLANVASGAAWHDFVQAASHLVDILSRRIIYDGEIELRHQVIVWQTILSMPERHLTRAKKLVEAAEKMSVRPVAGSGE